jgi:hypothetical protein
MSEQAYTTIAVAEDRIMLDSTNPRAIAAAKRAGQKFRGLPVSLAGIYFDGAFKASSADLAELHDAGFDNRSLVGITVLGSGGEAMKSAADDTETGNDNAYQTSVWALAEHQAHHWPVAYSNRSRKPRVIARCTARGLRLSTDYGLWVATLDGTFQDTDGSDLRTQPGVVGIQVEQANSPIHVAGQPPDLDVTVVVSTAWRAPKPAPEPKALDGYLVLAGHAGLAGRGVTSHDGGKTWA